jgi:ferredoxin-NADP reductase
MPRDSNPVVVLRASSADQLVLRDEVAELVRRRRGVLHEMIGARSDTSRMGRELRRLIPDLAKRDLYVFGPPGLVEDVVEAGRVLGVPEGSLHREIFSW